MAGQRTTNWILFVLLALIWGSSFILIKKGTVHLSGTQIGALRIFSAAVVFFPLAIFHLRQLPKNKIPVVLLTGLLGNLLPAFLFAIAVGKIASSIAGILNSLTPLFVIVIGVLFFKVKVQSKKMVGVMIGFSGLLILSLSKGPVTGDNFGYILMVLLATVCYGLNVNVVSTYLKGIDPFKMSTVSVGFLIIPTALVLWLHPLPLSAPEARVSILSVVALGLLGSAAATVIFYALIKRAGGLFASLVTYAIPVVAIFWGLLAKEDIGAIQFGCLAVILSGVYLANK